MFFSHLHRRIEIFKNYRMKQLVRHQKFWSVKLLMKKIDEKAE